MTSRGWGSEHAPRRACCTHPGLDPATLLCPFEICLFHNAVVRLFLVVAHVTELFEDHREQLVRLRGIKLLVDLLLLVCTTLQCHPQCFGPPPTVLVHFGGEDARDDCLDLIGAQLHRGTTASQVGSTSRTEARDALRVQRLCACSVGARRAALNARSDTEALQRAIGAARLRGRSSHRCSHCCSTRVGWPAMSTD